MRPLSSLVLVTALLLAGCGVSPTSQGLSVVGNHSARGLVAEVAPSDDALARLEARSPDELVDNPAPEPGANTEGWGPQPPKEDLGNFGKVDETLWRGARPTDKGLAQLAEMGVKTIVNFENDKKVVEHERAWAEAHGIQFHAIPLSVITPPRTAKIDQWLKVANEPANRPLYFHCMQGRDRTGTAAFTYRMTHDKWGYKQAYAEMKTYKFHTYLLGLQGFLLWFAPKHPNPSQSPTLGLVSP